jgi:hypothetical protein
MLSPTPDRFTHCLIVTGRTTDFNDPPNPFSITDRRAPISQG